MPSQSGISHCGVVETLIGCGIVRYTCTDLDLPVDFTVLLAIEYEAIVCLLVPNLCYKRILSNLYIVYTAIKLT